MKKTGLALAGIPIQTPSSPNRASDIRDPWNLSAMGVGLDMPALRFAPAGMMKEGFAPAARGVAGGVGFLVGNQAGACSRPSLRSSDQAPAPSRNCATASTTRYSGYSQPPPALLKTQPFPRCT